ncbi:MAG: type II toxin-antitoxin system VapC family toxin, partial [Candidatus Limnocylindrales bacterium]
AHTLLWWLADDLTLDRGAMRAIQDPANDVLVSAATVWEIAIKRSIGKLEAPEGLVAVIDQAGMDLIPITGTDAEAAGGLPAHHRDPFDRMLVAQADRIGAIVVSRDTAFAAYGVPILPA